MGRTKGKSSNANSKKKDETINIDIAGIIYIASGIILGIAIYTSLAGVLSSLAQRLSYALIGLGAYTLPLYLIYFGFQYIKTRGNVELNKNFFGISLLVVVLMLTCGTINIQTLDNPNEFLGNLKSIISDNNGIIHGGIISYFIYYIYKIITFLKFSISIFFFCLPIPL